MQSETDLQAVARRLPPELSRRVPYANNLQKHMLGLVETCVEHRDGIAYLIGAVRFFEGDTDPMRALDGFLAERQLEGDVWAQVTVGLGGTGGGARARAAAGVSLLCNVPGRTACFVGRTAELDRLEALLASGSDARIAASVEGLAGIGKTELALQLVYRLASRGHFPGGVFWFDAEDPDLTPSWGAEVADALALPAGSIEARARAAVDAVSRRDTPTLLVLDNVKAWDREQTPTPLPAGPHLRWLVTTRSRRLGGARFKHVAVGFLDRGPALTLLEEVSGRELAASPGTDALLDHLDGHALALELAGAYLGEFPAETPAGYLRRLHADPDTEARVSDQLGRYQHTVANALATIWQQLDATARRAWHIAACFEPESVGERLAAAAGLGADALRELRRRHLIDTAPDGRWHMHRLTREFGQRVGTDAERADARRAFVLGCVAYARDIDISDGYRIYLPERAHFDTALELAPAVLGDHDRRLSNLHIAIAAAWYALGDYGRARTLMERALEADLRNLGEHHPSVARSRSNLAGVLKELGELDEARDLLRLALDADLRNLGERHPSVATSRSNLAMVLRNLGELDEARDLLRLSLDADLHNLSARHPSVTIRRSNLAMVLRELNELDEARDLLRLALDTDLHNLGEHHPNVAIRRSNLALVLRDLGEFREAHELLRLALDADLRNFGEHHPSVARTRLNLALVLRDLGEFCEAHELLRLALDAGLRNFDEHHPSVATTRSKLAMALWDLDEVGEAHDLLRRTLDSELRTLGESHPRVARTRSNLAMVLRDLGELDQARDLLRVALDFHLDKFGEHHPSVASTRSNLAMVLRDLGELDQARDLLHLALDVRLDKFGEHHPSVAKCRAHLALVLKDLGEPDEARALLRLALTRLLDRYGEQHRHVPEIRAYLDDLERIMGNAKGA